MHGFIEAAEIIFHWNWSFILLAISKQPKKHKKALRISHAIAKSLTNPYVNVCIITTIIYKCGQFDSRMSRVRALFLTSFMQNSNNNQKRRRFLTKELYGHCN